MPTRAHLVYFAWLEIVNTKYLQPMYKKLHQAIRRYDDSHIIFFEPVEDFVSEVSQQLCTKSPKTLSA